MKQQSTQYNNNAITMYTSLILFALFYVTFLAKSRLVPASRKLLRRVAVNDCRIRACNKTGVGSSLILMGPWSRVPHELILSRRSVTVLQQCNTGPWANIIHYSQTHPVKIGFYYYHPIYAQFFQVIFFIHYLNTKRVLLYLPACGRTMAQPVSRRSHRGGPVSIPVTPCWICVGRYTVSVGDIVVK